MKAIAAIGFIVFAIVALTLAIHGLFGRSIGFVSAEDAEMSVAYICGYVDGQHRAIDILNRTHSPDEPPECEEFRGAARNHGFVLSELGAAP